MPVHLIDHLTVTAKNLEIGAQFVYQALGVMPQVGGEHPRMGTHNLLLKLGDALFLEVIAPNPQVPAPQRPRWFGLDTLRLNSAPKLATWVVSTADIHASAHACCEPLGSIEVMSRGTLNWLISIPDDGSLPMDGIAPSLIEWQAAAHPASKLEEHGLALVRLELYHPEAARLARLLASLELANLVHVFSVEKDQPARLVAHINTPRGIRILE